MATTCCACLVKDPDAKLNYGFDWGDWLGSDTIQQSNWEVVEGTITTSSEAVDSTNRKTEIWLEGGTKGATVQIRNRITTVGGLKDDRTLEIRIMER